MKKEKKRKGDIISHEQKALLKKAAFNLVVNGLAITQDSISKETGLPRSWLTRRKLKEPESFLMLIFSDPAIYRRESAKLQDRLKPICSIESYMLVLFQIVHGWTENWERESTIWSIMPDYRNSFFLETLRTSTLRLFSKQIENTLSKHEIMNFSDKATGLANLLIGSILMQGRILLMPNSTEMKECLYKLYSSTCSNMKRLIGKKVSHFFPEKAELFISRRIHHSRQEFQATIGSLSWELPSEWDLK